jgi:hypothetical protein
MGDMSDMVHTWKCPVAVHGRDCLGYMKAKPHTGAHMLLIKLMPKSAWHQSSFFVYNEVGAAEGQYKYITVTVCHLHRDAYDERQEGQDAGNE